MGPLVSCSGYGYSLSASTKGGSCVAGLIDFSSIYVNLLAGSVRSNSMPVRCVQELAVVLLSVFSLPLSLG